MKTAGLLFFLIALFPVLPVQAESPELLFTAGKDAFKQKAYFTAKQRLNALLKIYPAYRKADEAAYLSALSDYYMQNYIFCISRLLQFKNTYPASEYNGEIQYWLGACYYHLNQYEKAIEHFRLQTLDPAQIYYFRALYYQGMALEKTGNWEAAREQFLIITTAGQDPRTLEEQEVVVNLLYKFGTVEYTGGDYQEALIYFKKLLVTFPAYSLSYNVAFYIAECYYLLGGYEAAQERYKNALALYPASLHRETCLFRLAEIYLTLTQYQAALDYLLLYEKEFPAGKYINRVIHYKAPLFFQLRNYREAIPCYLQILESAQEQERQLIYYKLGLASQNTGQYEWAEQYFHLSLNDSDLTVAENSLLKLAWIYMELQLDTEVIRSLEIFMEKFPQSLSKEQVLRFLALYYMKKGNPESALDSWNRLITEFSNSFYRDEYYLKRGLTYISLGEYMDALGDLQAIPVLFPDSRFVLQAYYHIGYIYSLNYEYMRAFEYYDYILQAEAKGELRERTLLAKGANYYNLGFFDQALGSFNAALLQTDHKWTGIIFYCMGLSYFKVNQTEKAKESFNLAREYFQANPGVLDSSYWMQGKGADNNSR